MTFTTKKYIKYLTPFPALLWILLTIYLIYNFPDQAERAENILWLIILTFAFFFGLTYWTIRNFKNIERKDGKWTITYPYRKRTIILTKENVTKIEILENISAKNLPSHTQINIRIKSEHSVYINSLETSDFVKLRKLISSDFSSY